MKIYLKIEKDTFMAMAGIVSRVFTECNERRFEPSLVPRNYWTIAIHFYKMSTVYVRWNEKSNTKRYSYWIYIDLALALLEYLQTTRGITYYEQKLLDTLHLALTNRNFSSESLNMKTLQA